MKYIILLVSCIVLRLSAGAQNLYQLSFGQINGDSASMSAYVGMKLMFYVLPLHATDSAYAQLQRFKSRYHDSIQVIGITSIDDGYQNAEASSVQSLYNGMGVLVTAGMYTKKSSGASQSPLMKWLTYRTQNTHFDMDSQGIGQKFFVDAYGRLYAVMPPELSLDAPIIATIVHGTPR